MAKEYDGTEVITQKIVVFWNVENDWIAIIIDGKLYYKGPAEVYNFGPDRLSEKMEDSALIYIQ